MKTSYRFSGDGYSFTCGKCEGEWWVKEYDIKKSDGYAICPHCGNELEVVFEEKAADKGSGPAYPYQDHLVHYMYETTSTAIYPQKHAMEYLALGLASEAGELAGIIKKYIRDGEFDHKNYKSELGDVMWYWARLCLQSGLNPIAVLDYNLEKLAERKRKNTLGGNGDER